MLLYLMFSALLGTLTLAQNQTGFMFNIRSNNQSVAMMTIGMGAKLNVTESSVVNNTKPGWTSLMSRDELYSWARMVVHDYDKETKRIKREGFGPWEAQETWDEKGKANLIAVVETISEVVSEIVNETRFIIDEIEHPITFLLKTKVGTIILIVVALCLLAVIIIAVGPITRAVVFVLSCFWKPFRWMTKLSCCIYLWSVKPIRKIRNHYIEKKKLEEEMKTLRVYTHEPNEEIALLKRTYSNVFTDDHGAYMLASDNHRVYFEPAVAVEDILTVKTLAPPNRDTGGGKAKETVLVNSKLYKTEKIPDFQGQFDVDGNVIGHFSRIRFRGNDCLLTAYHVLDYNRTALIRLRKGDKLIDFNVLSSTEVLAASPAHHLDYVIIKVPSHVFGALGIKIGSFSTRVMPREAICIYQLYEGKPCVSTAAIKLYGKKPWHIAYSASTTVGTSGAPILDTRGSILGVHLEHDSVTQLNVGVVPPVFRDPRGVSKESPTNEDLMQHERQMMWDDYDSDGNYRRNRPEYEEENDDYDEDGDEYKRQRYDEDEELEERYLTFARGKNKNKDWESDFNDIEREALRDLEDDADFEQKFGDNSLASFMVIRLAENARRKYNFKHGMSQKESPWTCKRCGCLHYKLQHNCAKCKLSFEPASNRKEVKQFVDAQMRALHDERSVLPETVKRIIEQKLKSINIHKEICGLVAETLKQGKINVYDLADITEVVRNTLWVQKDGTWSVQFEDLGTGNKTPIPIEKKSFQQLVQSGDKTAAQDGWTRECDGTACPREVAETHEKGPQSSKFACEAKARAVNREVLPTETHLSTKCLEVYKDVIAPIITNTGRMRTDHDGDVMFKTKKVHSYVPVTFETVLTDCNHTMGFDTTRHGKDAHPGILELGAQRRVQRLARKPVEQFEYIADTNLFSGELTNQKLAKVEEECLQQMSDFPKSRKETITPAPKTDSLSASAKRNLRRKANKKIRKEQVENYKARASSEVQPSSKETQVSFAEPKEEVPLNSSAPAQTGASAIIGSTQNLSQNRPSVLEDPSANSTPVQKTARAKSGKRSVKSNQSTESTTGQSDLQKQRK